MRIATAIFCFSFLISASGFSQTEQRPKYAPRHEKHKNKTDVLGLKQGVWKHYNANRQLIFEEEYADNVRNGLSKRYFANDRLSRETAYKYGIKEGIYKRYYYEGQVKTEGWYEGGKKAGYWTNYFYDGQVQNEGYYSNGRKEGIWKYYNHKGALVNTITFKNGKDNREILAEEKRKVAASEADAKKKAGKNLSAPKIKVAPANALINDSIPKPNEPEPKRKAPLD